MPGSAISHRASFIESLEQRCLLALNTFGNQIQVSKAGLSPFSASDSAVSSGTGDYIVVQEDVVKRITTVTAVRYSSAGKLMGTEFVLAKSSYDEAFALGVGVSMDSAGDAVLAYDVGANGTLAAGVYVNLLSKTGTLSQPILVTTDAANSPVVWMDPMGRFFVAWVDDESNPHVNVRSYDATGKPRGAAFTGSFEDDFLNISNLSIASKRDGSGAVIAFSPSFINAAFDRVTTTGRVGNSDKEIVVTGGGTAGPVGGTSVAMESDGSFLIGYLRSDNSGAVQHYSSTGTAMGNPIEVTAGLATNDVNGLSIAPLSSGGFAAGISQMVGSQEVLFAQEYDSQGVPDSPTAVEVASGPVIEDASIGADAGGNLLESFLLADSDLVTASSSVNYRRITSNIAAIDQSVLYVFGTDDAAHGDAIAVQTKALSIVVNRGTTIRKFAATAITGVNIVGLGGNDSIDNATALPSTINGGNGNDTLRGGSGNDLLIGGKGKDKMYGYAGVDTFVAKDNARDTLDGGDGLDILASHDRVDTLRNIP